jgi:hypothetical protein
MQEIILQLQQDHAFDLNYLTIYHRSPPVPMRKILAAMATGLILVTKLGKTDRLCPEKSARSI